MPSHRHRPHHTLLIALITTLALHRALAHQSIGFPYPITRDVACRINFNANCPGPCPTREPRVDMTPNNPSITAARGGWISVNTLANNHRGGFSRWSLVNVRDMYSKQKHKENAFLFTCADLSVTKCTRRNKMRDCNYDLKNEYYRHSIQIPYVIPDGVYVLGWVWYGGGERWGLFGDYYDCMYIRVRGGPQYYSYRPVFRTGNTYSGRYGRCRATVNRIGICWREPCPGGGRFTTFQKPWEFTNRIPSPLTRSHFPNPYRLKPRGPRSPWVKSMTIRSADTPGKIYTSSLYTRFPYIYLTTRMRPTVTCEVFGNVRSVTFYTNGRKGRTDSHRPYSIAGDWVDWRSQRSHFAPFKFDIDRKVVVLSCKALGWDGVEDWKTVELSTNF